MSCDWPGMAQLLPVVYVLRGKRFLRILSSSPPPPDLIFRKAIYIPPHTIILLYAPSQQWPTVEQPGLGLIVTLSSHTCCGHTLLNEFQFSGWGGSPDVGVACQKRRAAGLGACTQRWGGRGRPDREGLEVEGAGCKP